MPCEFGRTPYNQFESPCSGFSGGSGDRTADTVGSSEMKMPDSNGGFRKDEDPGSSDSYNPDA